MNTTNYVYELAINKAKDWKEFSESRSEFVEQLGLEEASLNEGKWKPFFSFAEMDLEPVLIGMTHWKSLESFGEVAQRLLPQRMAKRYFASFEPLTYGLLESLDGEAFDMESIKSEGLTVEFALRKAKTPDAFGAPHDSFFDSLEQYPGFKFYREFKFYELNEKGIPVLQDNTQAVIIVWESVAKFQEAVPNIMQSAEANDFMPKLEVKAYFAASPDLG